MGIWIVFIDFLLEQGLKISQGLLSSLVILQITLDLGLTSQILKSKLVFPSPGRQLIVWLLSFWLSVVFPTLLQAESILKYYQIQDFNKHPVPLGLAVLCKF